MNTVITYRDSTPFVPGVPAFKEPPGAVQGELGDTQQGRTIFSPTSDRVKTRQAAGSGFPQQSPPVVPEFSETALRGREEASLRSSGSRSTVIGDHPEMDAASASVRTPNLPRRFSETVPDVALDAGVVGPDAHAGGPARTSRETARNSLGRESTVASHRFEDFENVRGRDGGDKSGDRSGVISSRRTVESTSEFSPQPPDSQDITREHSSPVLAVGSRDRSRDRSGDVPGDPRSPLSRRLVADDAPAATSHGESQELPETLRPRGGPVGTLSRGRPSRTAPTLSDPPETLAEEGTSSTGSVASPSANHRTVSPKLEKIKDEQPSGQPRRMMLTGSLQLVNGNGQSVGQGVVRMEAR